MQFIIEDIDEDGVNQEEEDFDENYQDSDDYEEEEIDFEKVYDRLENFNICWVDFTSSCEMSGSPRKSIPL